ALSLRRTTRISPAAIAREALADTVAVPVVLQAEDWNPHVYIGLDADLSERIGLGQRQILLSEGSFVQQVLATMALNMMDGDFEVTDENGYKLLPTTRVGEGAVLRLKAMQASSVGGPGVPHAHSQETQAISLHADHLSAAA